MKKLLFLLLVAILMGCGGGGGGGETGSSGSAPVVTTLAANSITPAGAVLNGTAIPNGIQTQSWFEYGTDFALATYTTTPKQDAGNGLTIQAANATLSCLAAGTMYYFRFCAENSQGCSKGAIVNCTTSSPGASPTVQTLAATSIGATGATLNAYVSPNSLATTTWFEWGTDPTLAVCITTSSHSAGSGTTSQLVSATLTGLSAGTKYYGRIAANNGSGTSRGTIASFTTGTGLGGWISTGSMGTARIFPTATLLGNGKVLIAGGGNGNGDLSSGELYDPGTGTFTPTGEMANAHIFSTATLLPNGKVLVAGGQNNSGGISSAELYNPDTGTFTPTGSMGTARCDYTATLLPNGKVLVSGGEGSNGIPLSSAELYDPGTGTFSSTGSMGIPREDHTATLLPNGKVLVVGGWYLSGTDTCRQKSAELYDPATGTFTATGAMGTARCLHTATLLPNGKVLVAGGKDLVDINSAELYDPGTGTFSDTGSMATPRDGHTATLLPIGMVLVVAGGKDIGPNGSILNSAELYDPGTGTFTPAGAMGTARYSHTATLLPNGKLLVAGGMGSNNNQLSSAELYGPGTGE